MKILILSHGVIEKDARLRELISAFRLIGDVQYTCRSVGTGNANNDPQRHIFANKSNRSQFLNMINFYYFCRNIALKLEGLDILVSDNRYTIAPTIWISRILKKKPVMLIHDSREMYDYRDMRHLSGKIGSISERIYLKYFDILSCAGQERASIMQDKYGLRRRPIVFENIRKLSYEKGFSKCEAARRFDRYFNKDAKYVISTNGLIVARQTDRLVRVFSELGDEYQLILAGVARKSDADEINRIIEEHRITNVNYLGYLNESDLKYVISRSAVGVVSYAQRTRNEIFCMSGKVYEYLYEGLPLVTTSNPPLLRLCSDYGVGITDDNFKDGIIQVFDDYEKYQNNVNTYISGVDVKENNQMYSSEVLRLFAELKPL